MICSVEASKATECPHQSSPCPPIFCLLPDCLMSPSCWFDGEFWQLCSHTWEVLLIHIKCHPCHFPRIWQFWTGGRVMVKYARSHQGEESDSGLSCVELYHHCSSSKEEGDEGKESEEKHIVICNITFTQSYLAFPWMNNERHSQPLKAGNIKVLSVSMGRT